MHVSGFSAADDRVGAVVFVEGFKNDHFIARIDDGHQRVDHAFRGAAAHRDLTLGVDLDAQESLRLVRQGVAKTFRAPRNCVLVDVGENGVRGGLLEHFGRGKVGISLGEIDRLVFHGEARHFANHRFRELRRFIGNLFLEHTFV